MPRRTRPSARGQRARWIRSEPLTPERKKCGCKTDDSWLCDRHLAERRGAMQAAAQPPEATP